MLMFPKPQDYTPVPSASSLVDHAAKYRECRDMVDFLVVTSEPDTSFRDKMAGILSFAWTRQTPQQAEIADILKQMCECASRAADEGDYLNAAMAVNEISVYNRDHCENPAIKTASARVAHKIFRRVQIDGYIPEIPT